MSNFTKWNDSFQERANSDEPLHAIMFVARNKDNRDLPNFKERREVFLTTQPEESPILKQKFLEFAKRGQKNELSRLYISLNARNQQQIRISFMHYYFDHSDQSNEILIDSLGTIGLSTLLALIVQTLIIMPFVSLTQNNITAYNTIINIIVIAINCIIFSICYHKS